MTPSQRSSRLTGLPVPYMIASTIKTHVATILVASQARMCGFVVGMMHCCLSEKVRHDWLLGSRPCKPRYRIVAPCNYSVVLAIAKSAGALLPYRCVIRESV